MRLRSAHIVAAIIFIVLITGCGAAAPVQSPPTTLPATQVPAMPSATATLPAPTPVPTEIPSPTPAPARTAAPVVTVTPVITERVKLDDITMYYAAYGQGEPLILLHGGMGSSDNFVGQVPAFAQQYRVITPDSRGQGRTTDSDAAISYHLMAEDTLRLMEYLKLSSAYIVGWSDGAIIGLDLALHHPERVRALVSFAANTNPDGLTTAAQDLFRYGGPLLTSEYLRLSPTPERVDIIMEKMRKLWTTEPNFTAAELGSIKPPTLISDGEMEELIKIDHVKAIAAAMPQARFVLMRNTGHMAPTQRPDEFNQMVLDFLKQAAGTIN